MFYIRGLVYAISPSSEPFVVVCVIIMYHTTHTNTIDPVLFSFSLFFFLSFAANLFAFQVKYGAFNYRHFCA